MADLVVITMMGMAGLSRATPWLILVGAFALSIENCYALVASYLTAPAAWPNEQVMAIFYYNLRRGLLACIIAYLSGVLVTLAFP
jgi:hypothetical protein